MHDLRAQDLALAFFAVIALSALLSTLHKAGEVSGAALYLSGVLF